VWPDVEVDVNVVTQDVAGSKTFAAEIAAIGFLSVRQMHGELVPFQGCLVERET
jgi:hypothetical protein